ncbi:MAG: S8 family peptidase [Actinomycetes bacterium]
MSTEVSTSGPPRSRRLPQPSSDTLSRHGGRLLDPVTAVRRPGVPPPRPTAYVADQLVVAAGVDQAAMLTRLERAARECHATLELEPLGTQLSEQGHDVPRTVRLLPADDGPAEPRDAWQVLQRFRAAAGGHHAAVGLDHLLFGIADPVGLPQTEGHGTTGLPQTEGHGTGDHLVAGRGGRAPVTWVGQRPHRRPDRELTGRRPVVAVLDTGCGPHPWLDGVVQTDVRLDGVPAGLTDPATDPEAHGDLVGPLVGALDTHAGHGTFIAGLVHQICPDADVLAIRVMASDGVVKESALLHALGVLRVLAQRYRDSGGADGRAVDVVVLSLGYHHESPDDAAFDTPLLAAVTALGELGCAVVAAAGNSATTDPLYPAAFAPHAGGPVPAVVDGCVPVTSVAATNPDGTVALFSNAGTWIRCWQKGAALVSTMPTTFNGGRQPVVRYTAPDGSPRATLDPDDFRDGFGVWSGTSFAAPVCAGHLVRRLWEDAGGTGLDPVLDVATVGGVVEQHVAEHPMPLAPEER